MAYHQSRHDGGRNLYRFSPLNFEWWVLERIQMSFIQRTPGCLDLVRISQNGIGLTWKSVGHHDLTKKDTGKLFYIQVIGIDGLLVLQG
jgi:hypothetical protein